MSIGIAVATVAILQFLSTAYGLTAEEEKSFRDNVKVADDHCLNNVDQILAGGNPVQDLFKAGLIPTYLADYTCKDIHTIITHSVTESALSSLFENGTRIDKVMFHNGTLIELSKK